MKSVAANRLPREKFLRGAPVMDLLGFGGIVRRVLFICVLVCFMAGLVAGNVVLIGKNVSLSFDDIEATFAPPIKGSGECGALYIAEPLDACTPLKNKVAEGPNSPFVLIKRGECTFDDKVRSAQRAGFKAAIVYDNEDSGVLVAMTPASRMSISMMPASLVPTRKRVFLENKLGCGKLAVAGSSNGIRIHAVFVSKASGESLKKYAGRTDVELWIIPTVENSAWSIMAISFISLLAMSAVLATCFFVRRHRIRRERPRVPNIREFHGMSSRLVKAIPSLIFTSVLEDNSTSRTCAICLEDYTVGEKLRVLPCRHKFHALCVDAWLTTWRTFCPVCKQDVRTSTCNPPASEYTPLLSAAPSRSSSTSALSSFHSSVSASPSLAIPIMRTPPQSPLNSRTHSLSSFPHVPNPHRSYSNSPAVSISRNSLNLRNSSSHRSLHSFGLSSPMNSRYMMPPYVPSPSNGSPSYLLASSGRQSYLRRCGESGASLSAQASDHSLPGCG